MSLRVSYIAVNKIKGQVTGILTAIYMGYGRMDMKGGEMGIAKGREEGEIGGNYAKPLHILQLSKG